MNILKFPIKRFIRYISNMIFKKNSNENIALIDINKLNFQRDPKTNKLKIIAYDPNQEHVTITTIGNKQFDDKSSKIKSIDDPKSYHVYFPNE